MTHGQNGAVDSDALRKDAWQRIRAIGSVERLTPNDGGWNDGTAALDRAVDSGAGVALLLESGAPTAAARAITALYTNTDATAVVSGTSSDLQWMQLCAEVRDAMVQLRPAIADPSLLLAPDPRLAFMVAAIVAAAARRTPIVIGGALPHIAALAAQRIASQSTIWVFSALDDTDLAAQAARKRLGLTPWMTLDWRTSDEHAEALVRVLVEDLDAV